MHLIKRENNMWHVFLVGGVGLPRKFNTVIARYVHFLPSELENTKVVFKAEEVSGTIYPKKSRFPLGELTKLTITNDGKVHRGGPTSATISSADTVLFLETGEIYALLPQPFRVVE